MKLSQFKFKLPEVMATKFRDECRLMVLHKRPVRLSTRMFKDILEYF